MWCHNAESPLLCLLQKNSSEKAVPKSGSEKWFGNAGANAVVQSGEAVRAQEIQIGCQQYNTE
jgi:hypothetical protein